jgi:hypothetical protein
MEKIKKVKKGNISERYIVQRKRKRKRVENH